MQEIYVLLEDTDLEHLEEVPAGASPIVWIAVSPSLEHQLRIRSTSSFRGMRTYGNFSHGRTAATSAELLRDFPRYFTAPLPREILHILRQNFFFLGNLSSRFWLTLGQTGPWRICVQGRWLKFADKIEAHRAGLRKLIDFEYLDSFPRAEPERNSKAWYWSVLSVARRWVVAPATNLKLGILDETHDGLSRNTGILAFAPPERTPRSVKGIAAALTRSIFGRSRMFSIPWERAVIQEFHELESALVSGFSRLPTSPEYEAIRLAEEVLTRTSVKTAQSFESTRDAIRALRPGIMVAHEMNTPSAALLGRICGDEGIPVCVANHNSLLTNSSRLANLVTRSIIEQRITAFGPVRVLAWSPNQARAIRDVAHYVGEVIPVRLPLAGKLRRKSDEFRVLHAGNYIGWNVFFPWIGETSFEYLEGIREVAHALRGLSNVRLDIRVRPKGECGPSVVSEAVRPGGNIHVNSTTECTYFDQLSEADLVVGFMSTTLEEALQARKPVLLLGPTDRYRHFSADENPPTASRRSAVYVVRSGGDVRKMVEAIRIAHIGRPLTDDEVSGFEWPASTPSVARSLEIEMMKERKG